MIQDMEDRVQHKEPVLIGGLVALLYGVVVYAIFLATVLYAIGFVGNLVVPKSIDSGARGSLVEALVVNAALLGLFGIQHSVMARAAFKRWWVRFVPVSVERSTYVLLASAALLLLFWQWRPIPTLIWVVANPFVVAALNTVFWLGWFLLIISTFLISHFELFGLSQGFNRLVGKESSPPVFMTP